MLAIITRLKFEDYKVLGDDIKYDKFFDDCKKHELTRLFDTTQKTVLVWKKYIFVTGISTSRKDKVNTPIRYSFLMEVENSSERTKLFFSLKKYLENDNKELGNNFDNILNINDLCNTLPIKIEKENIIAAINKNIPSVTIKDNIPHDAEYYLWTTFKPLKDKDELTKFVDSLPRLPPKRFAIFDNIEIPVKKKTSRIWIVVLLGIFFLASLTIFFMENNQKNVNVQQKQMIR